MTLRPAPLFWAPLLLGSLVELGCNEGQIGGEVGDGSEQTDPARTADTPPGGGEDPTENPNIGVGPGMGGEGTLGWGEQCEDVETIPVGPGEPTMLGFAGQALLDLVGGPHEAELVWGPSSAGMPLAVDYELIPAAGDSTVRVEVTPDVSTLRLVERRPVAEDSATGQEAGPMVLGDTAGECPSELRVDARVEVTTENGALDDSFSVTLATSSATSVNVGIPVEPGGLNGSFDVVVADTEGTKAVQTTLTLAFAPGAFSGALAGSLQVTTEAVASAAGVTYGYFPRERCESGVLVGADSTFAQSLQAELDTLSNFDLTWPEGDTTTLTLSHQVRQICLDPIWAMGDPMAVIQLDSSASTADQRIDGTWQLEAQVSLDPTGAPAATRILRQAYLANTYPAAQFEAATGISGFDLGDAEQATFFLDLAPSETEEGAAQGSLTIFAVSPLSCPPPADLPNNATAPGCAGNEAVELGVATLVAAE